MTLKEKILYALASFTYVSRQALLTMCENPIYGYRVIKKLMKGGYVKEITRNIKIRGRPRYYTCLRITDKGLAFLTTSLMDSKGEEGWVKYLPTKSELDAHNEGMSSIDLYLHTGQSTATMVSLMAGAAVLPLLRDKTQNENTIMGNSGIEVMRPDNIKEVETGGGISTFADNMEEMVAHAMKTASHEQKLNGYVFNAKSKMVFYNAKVIKTKLCETANDSAKKIYRASRFAGILQSPLKSVILYSGRKGGMSWSKWIVVKEINTYRTFTVHHSKYKNKDGGITRGVLIVENPRMLEIIYKDKFGYRKQKNENFGSSFTSMLIIPVSYEGAMCLSEYMNENMDSFERTFAESAIASGMYVKNEEDHRDLFPIREKTTNLPVFIGSYMDGIRLNRLNATYGKSPFDYAVLCREWQVEYYQRVTDAKQYFTFRLD